MEMIRKSVSDVLVVAELLQDTAKAYCVERLVKRHLN